MPDGVGPGTTLLVTAPDGRQAKVELPDGVHPGDERDFYVGTSLETSALFPRHPTPRADELNPMDRGAILQSVRIVGQNRAGTPPRLSRGDRQLTPTRGSVRASQAPRAFRSSMPIQPVRAELGQLGLGTLRKQAVLEGASQVQINEALNSDDAKQQIIEMVVLAQSDKVAAAKMAAVEEESQLQEQIRLGALVMKRQEQERAVEELRVELTGLRLGDLQQHALLSGIMSDLVEEAMDDPSDAKQALIAICIEAELGGLIYQEPHSLSPIPTMSMLGSPSRPTRVSPGMRGWASPPRDPPPLPASPPRDPPPLPALHAVTVAESIQHVPQPQAERRP